MCKHPSAELFEVSQQPERVGTGKAFGTFGELLQGRLEEKDSDFLVTFPIACYSYATFVPKPESTTLAVFPPQKWKSQKLANMILEHYALPRGGEVTIESNLAVGKGLASSSADLVATARSLSSYFGIKIPLSLLQDFLREIEPSDGVMYPGVVSFYHRRARLREFLGFLPPIVIVGLDEGGEVDTCEFNKIPKSFTTADEQEYSYLLYALAVAIREQDLNAIGRITTRSAELNQKLNPKQTLGDLITICEEIQGLGVVVAHSGTCLGILLSPQNEHYHQQLQIARDHLSKLDGITLIYNSLVFDKWRQ